MKHKKVHPGLRGEDLEVLARRIAELLQSRPWQPKVRLSEIASRLLPAATRGLVCPGDLEANWRIHILPSLGNETQDTLSKEKACAFADGLALAPRTRNKIRWAALTLLEKAREAGIWDATNPFRVIKRARVSARHVRILTPAEVLRASQKANGWFRVAMLVAFFTGARKGELFAWRRQDIDLKRKLMSFCGSHGRPVTKNGEHRLNIPINEQLVPYLREWLASHQSQYVFPGKSGKRRHRTGHVERMFRRALVEAGLVDGYTHTCRRCRRKERHDTAKMGHCDRCGMKLWVEPIPIHLVFHDLRHIASTLFQEKGVPMAVVKRILGHKSGDITDLYTHHTEKFMRRMINRLRLPFPGMTSEKYSAPGGSRTPDLRIRSPKAEGFNPWAPQPVSVIAKALRVSASTVYRWVQSGELIPSRHNTQLRISPKQVELLIERHQLFACGHR